MYSQNSNDDYEMDNQLNQSRFLLQEINLQQQPTQQQVLQRAEELEIDDLVLAKQSLTKQLDPQWKPYCNRRRQIYYINLLERLAYVDHPIDMYFKKQYARLNQMPIPRFKSYKIEQIAKSMDLIEEQIRNFKTGSYKTTLKIVYEEPSQQQALSSHPKSPANFHDEFQSSNYFKQKQNELTTEELQMLHAYQKQLQQKYEQQFMKKKQQIDKKLKTKSQQHDKNMRMIKQRKISQMCQKLQAEINRKNSVDLMKQEQKLDLQYSSKRLQYCENIHNFNILFQRFRNKLRSIQSIWDEQNNSERIMMINNISSRCEFEKHKKIQATKLKAIKQFQHKISLLIGSSQVYQQNIKQSLSQSYRQLNQMHLKKYERNETKRDTIINDRHDNPLKQINSLRKNIEYQQLKKEINELLVWSEEQQKIVPLQDKLHKSLNLRLKMRII